jgi:hypothetical protein
MYIKYAVGIIDKRRLIGGWEMWCFSLVFVLGFNGNSPEERNGPMGIRTPVSGSEGRKDIQATS